jgi:DNA-directed RNA polymerase subunit beta'
MNTQDHTTFTPDTISLSLASPERIREWSYGEVLKPETINYRTGRSERGGLFDEKVFGPEKDYECYCGKYKRIRYAGIVCEKCGVEVTKAIVRRERMGHIELASPVAHIWFLRGIPSRMSTLLDIPINQLEKVIYFAGYIVTDIHQAEKDRILKELDNEYKIRMKTLDTDEEKDKLKDLFSTTKKDLVDLIPWKILTEVEFHKFSMKFSTVFEASIGAEAVYDVFRKLDLTEMANMLEKKLEKDPAARERIERRLHMIRALIASNQRPEWMFLTAIPVIPPALRPMVALEGGRHATSDVNDLYRRVINRNSRLKKLKEIGAPDVILRNEKRILQEAVDSLIDNTIRKHSGSVAMSQAQRRQLKSLADSLKGKQGILRANLLGKRVDYSGRSVIVVGPSLKLNQCGLPKFMALELFRPFVISKILKRELAYNIRGAGKLIEDGAPEVWEILEEVIQGKYVLLNRAPTLHRLSIQAFNPVLIEGKAIQIHPMVCSAFNADFDGDQMAVHVPLSEEAQIEARELIASNKNLLKPQSGDPVTQPAQDIVLGCYWATKIVPGALGESKIFSSPAEAVTAYDHGIVDVRAKIYVLPNTSMKYAAFDGKVFETSVGRILFNNVWPEDFEFVNTEVNKKAVANIIEVAINKYGFDATTPLLDTVKEFGYKFATKSGTTIGIDDALVPPEKKVIVEEGRKAESQIIEQFMDGLISDDERYNKLIELWEGVTRKIEKAIVSHLSESESISDQITSGARGNPAQLRQMAGMKGVIVNTAGRPVDFPIIASYKEGLSPIEYFITNHGSRKGLTDTALNTATAGYMTRKLVIVAQDVVILEEDCGTKKGMIVKAENIDGLVRPISKNVIGRVLAEPLKDSTGAVLFKRGHLVSREDGKVIDNAKVEQVVVRSPLTCDTLHGICQQCYGLDLGRNRMVKYGEAVGIVAAQAIGEPGTQLTLRTMHGGGVVGNDITAGLPRVAELFECRAIKIPAVISETKGQVIEIKDDGVQKTIVVLSDSAKSDADKLKEYPVDARRTVTVKVGQQVKAGDLLTDGAADPQTLYAVAGFDRVQEYIISEINKVYELHSAPISRKHLEIIVRQMFSRIRIKKANDTNFTTGQVVERGEFTKQNRIAESNRGLAAEGLELLRGITEVSLTAKSWMSASAFERVTRVLVNNAIEAGHDELRGLMENVMIGNLIPAGTGLSDEFVPALKDVVRDEHRDSSE